MRRHSDAARALGGQLGLDLDAAGLPNDFVLAVEPLTTGLGGRYQTRLFPSAAGASSPLGWIHPSAAWTAAEGASIGAFGMFVVGLEEETWG